MRTIILSKKTAAWALVVVISLYFYAMVLYPFFRGGWPQLHAVWFAWQTFNAGIIALMAALIGFYMTTRLAKKQADAQFVASRAFLPEALSVIVAYLDQCILVLNEALHKLATEDKNQQTLHSQVSELDREYRAIFAICIAHGPNDLRNALSKISKQLQICKSRMESLIEQQFQPNSFYAIAEYHIISELAEVCELYALINSLFDYARFESEEINTVLTNKDILSPVLKVRGDIVDKLSQYLSARK